MCKYIIQNKKLVCVHLKNVIMFSIHLLFTFILAENIIKLSKENEIIKGIVGWVDLMSENVKERIDRLKALSNGKLIGIRHLLQHEDFTWIWQAEVQRGLKCLEESGLAYDLSFEPPDLKHIPKLATLFPHMTFIIDHIAKAKARVDYENDIAWFEDMKIASQYPNVFCKL